jgi:hypothetical protein
VAIPWRTALGAVMLDVSGLRVVKPVAIWCRKDRYMSLAALRAVQVLKSTAAELARAQKITRDIAERRLSANSGRSSWFRQ